VLSRVISWIVFSYLTEAIHVSTRIIAKNALRMRLTHSKSREDRFCSFKQKRSDSDSERFSLHSFWED